MIQKILIANRGEIAVRVARTCREMGIATVAVFSEADAQAIHVAACDEGVAIGPAPSTDSYLVIENIIAAAQKTGADAIHPGYGFLAENAAFAEACAAAGIVFIGPSPEAIRVMGSKVESKRRMKDVGVPTIPGTEGEGDSLDALAKEASGLKFPLLIKASAGGGGKGMRRVDVPESLRSEMDIAAREAMKGFGDATLLVEHYVTSPRHVEIQVFGDSHGNIVHLFERECSIQRRHQKVIEESPSPGLTDKLRQTMGAAAVEAAKAVSYVGAGTVEFILDPEGNFYFLEMNTRLQVEHPVTEVVTGVDLVREQVRVAEGHPLSFSQEDLSLTGAAIECRIYAEDPAQGFLPATGTLVDWHAPALPGLRVDSGVASGSEVSIYYDPMLAKVIVEGRDREEAIRRMTLALRRLSAQGMVTNREFLIQVLEHPAFQSGDLDTHFIDTHFPEDGWKAAPCPSEHVAIAAVLLSADRDRKRQLLPGMLTGFRNNPYTPQTMIFEGDDEPVTAQYIHLGPGHYQVTVGDTEWTLEGLDWNGPQGAAILNGHRIEFRWVSSDKIVYLQSNLGASSLKTVPRFPAPGDTVAEGSCVSPMPGKVVSVQVSQGDTVTKGQVLASIEAMKMEHQVVAAQDGVIAQVLVAEGDQVDAQAPLVVMEETEE